MFYVLQKYRIKIWSLKSYLGQRKPDWDIPNWHEEAELDQNQPDSVFTSHNLFTGETQPFRSGISLGPKLYSKWCENTEIFTWCYFFFIQSLFFFLIWGLLSLEVKF